MLPPTLQALRDELAAKPVKVAHDTALLADLDAVAARSASLPTPATQAVGTRGLEPPPLSPGDPQPPGTMLVHQRGDDDIAMSVIPGATPSDEQQQLVLLVERTLSALRVIYRGQDAVFRQRFNTLLALAKSGLAGASPVPGLAKRMLEQFRTDVVEREATRLKQAHMQALGYACLRVGVLAALVGVFGTVSGPRYGVSPLVGTIGYLLAACAAGVWVSFAARKTAYDFEDLTLPERDYLTPKFRLAFAMILTTVLALMFHGKLATVAIGDVSSAAVLQRPLLAVMVGFLCGFSEQVLAQAVQQKASQLLKVS
ncbi:MAG: hypothetical protein SFW08_00160 [Gemmatimonadaceae bacterium]|nr:hypothetical protein [Gemmatimonadaceae bacterium]